MVRLLVPTLIALLAGLFAAFVYLAIKPVPQLTAGLHQIHWRPTADGARWELAGGSIGRFPVNALPGLTRLLWARITDNWWDTDLVEPYVESMERMKAIQLQRGRMSFTLAAE